MVGLALKGQYNLASIMVPPPEVSMSEKFSQKNRQTMFIAEKLRVMLYFIYCRWMIPVEAFRKLMIYISCYIS